MLSFNTFHNPAGRLEIVESEGKYTVFYKVGDILYKKSHNKIETALHSFKRMKGYMESNQEKIQKFLHSGFKKL